MEPAPEPPALPGFDYVRALGHGGFSEVYLYRQRLPRRQVAVKVLRIDAADTVTRREFVAEANAMAQLSSHPSIATIFAAEISAEGHPYLVMEFCPGGSLGARVKSGPIPVDEVLRIGVRMAAALESAHRAGIIHRDVKPSNILISELKAPVLTDFGISIGAAVSDTTIMRDSTTGTTRSSGLSVPWAPPEAFLDDPPSDPRSDLYSLAATLFTLLEGRTPFELTTGNNGAIALSRRIERGEITEPTTTDVPAAVHDLLRDAMAVDIEKRPSSALAFAERLMEQQSALGQPETPAEILDVSDNPDSSSSDAPVAMTTVIRARKSVDKTVQRSAPSAEVDVDTRPRPEKRPAHEAGRTKRRIPRRRWLAIGAAALLVACAAVAVPVFSGIKVPPCSTEFANQVSAESGRTDVRSIWWAYVPDLVTGPVGVVCGVTTDVKDIYVFDPASDAAISRPLNDNWTCTKNRNGNAVCADNATTAFVVIFDQFPESLTSLTPGASNESVYVEVHKAR